MSLADSIFLLVVLMTVAGALGTVLARNIIYSMMGLVAAMFGIAGLYIYLNAAFISMMQILIYVGSITVLIAFAIMMVGPLSHRITEWTTLKRFGAAAAVAAVSVLVFSGILAGAKWVPAQADAERLAVKDMGRALFDRFVLPFELVSLLIVVAIVGAIMLALLSKEEK
jgi:NADH-quinone oxidoreductase subunit J